MLISVIVPVYNVERYLRQCLDSLINQTYNELEVIMVDDGSKDSSGKICDEYSEKYDNFKVVHKENAGLGMARNTGFEHIKGEYVTFVDSDDYLEPDCIATLYNELRNKDVDMCKGGFKRVIDSGKIVSNRIYDNELFQGEKAKKEMLPRLLLMSEKVVFSMDGRYVYTVRDDGIMGKRKKITNDDFVAITSQSIELYEASNYSESCKKTFF